MINFRLAEFRGFTSLNQNLLTEFFHSLYRNRLTKVYWSDSWLFEIKNLDLYFIKHPYLKMGALKLQQHPSK